MEIFKAMEEKIRGKKRKSAIGEERIKLMEQAHLELEKEIISNKKGD
jgi:hypothetical protein